MLTVGLTGGIGSGKSTVAERLAQLGVPVIDTDQLSRDLVEPGMPALEEIVHTFGQELLNARGRLDRKALRARVFAEPNDRKRLEAILHPRIRAEMLRRLSTLDAPYAVLVIPLLVETGQADLADRVLVVDVPHAIQIQRVRQRDGSEEASVRRILAAQCNRATRLAAADDVIDNSGTPEQLTHQIRLLHRRYTQLAYQD
jgi:dephospho-CoA kinase